MNMSDIEHKLQSGIVYPEFFKLPLNSTVVNLGSGNGPQAVIYKQQFARMVGIDINPERVARSIEIADHLGISGFSAKVANVEDTGLEDEVADVVIAIDVIEHVQSPVSLLREANRLLKPGGTLLISYPTMHDIYLENRFIDLLRVILRKNRHQHSETESWDPDSHNQAMPIKQWIRLTESVEFKLESSRATTMFPPVHVFGMPKFWFTNPVVHYFDRHLSTVPMLKYFGQALLCRYVKS